MSKVAPNSKKYFFPFYGKVYQMVDALWKVNDNIAFRKLKQKKP